MNNSKFAIENVALTLESQSPNISKFREEEARLVRIISALQGIEKNKDWSSLKTELFDGLVASLERSLQSEAKKDSPDLGKIRHIAGQLKWAEKYSDLHKLEQEYKAQLTNIKSQLYGTTTQKPD